VALDLHAGTVRLSEVFHEIGPGLEDQKICGYLVGVRFSRVSVAVVIRRKLITLSPKTVWCGAFKSVALKLHAGTVRILEVFHEIGPGLEGQKIGGNLISIKFWRIERNASYAVERFRSAEHFGYRSED